MADRCDDCRDATPPFAFSFAFQPILDIRTGAVTSYEALVRGPNGEPAPSVLGQLTPETQYAFDQAARVRALELATRLGVDTRLNINFLPNAIYEPARCIRTTLSAASRLGFPADRIVFEVAETESVHDRDKLRGIFREYRRLGFLTAIDDFGAGYAGLGLLADFQPDIIKLDMAIVRDIGGDRAKRAIARAVVTMCDELGISLVAEGIETTEELAELRALGVVLFQGYLFARPAFEALPPVTLTALETR